MRRRAFSATVTAAILGIGGPAAADPTTTTAWEPPHILEDDVAAIGPVIASTTTDATVAAWIDHHAGEVRAAVRPPGQPWGSPTRIGGGVWSGLDVTPLPEGAAVATWCTEHRVMVRRLRGDGTWAAPRPIAAQVDIPWCYESFHVDAGGSGAMAVTWEREPGGGSDHPRLAYRSADGRWHAPERIPLDREAQDAQVVGVAVNTAGVTQVVYAEQRDNLSTARLMYLRRSPAGAWGEPAVIATPAPGSLRVLDHSVASDDRGNLAVVWQRPSMDLGPETVRARYRPAGGGSSFGPTAVLATVPYHHANHAVDMSGRGQATVAFLSGTEGDTVVRTARSIPGTATWGAGPDLYRPGGSHHWVGVAVNGTGEALVTVLDESTEPSDLRAALCPMFGPCGPAELVPGSHPQDQVFATDLGPTGVPKLLWTDPCGDGCQPRTVWASLGEPSTAP